MEMAHEVDSKARRHEFVLPWVLPRIVCAGGIRGVSVA